MIYKNTSIYSAESDPRAPEVRRNVVGMSTMMNGSHTHILETLHPNSS